MTTAEIVKVLREEARNEYETLRLYARVVFSNDKSICHRTADALRRAAKRLSRLADDQLAEDVLTTGYAAGTQVDNINAYRRALGVRP